MLKQNKKMDKSQQCIEHLQEAVETGRETFSMHAEMCELFKMVEWRKYFENLEKVFKWYKNLETHLINYKWKSISDYGVKRILCFCITGSARREIVLFHSISLASKKYGTGDFLEKC